MITEAQFTAAMRAAVAERGADYTYPSAVPDPGTADNIWGGYYYLQDNYHNDRHGGCVYSTPDGTPACIIGLALSKIDPDLVPAYDHSPSADLLLYTRASKVVAFAAEEAQEVQDNGGTWGEALAAYETYLDKCEQSPA